MHLLLTSYKGDLLCGVQKRMDQRPSIPTSETTISHAGYKSGHNFTKTFSNLNKIKFAPPENRKLLRWCSVFGRGMYQDEVGHGTCWFLVDK